MLKKLAKKDDNNDKGKKKATQQAPAPRPAPATAESSSTAPAWMSDFSCGSILGEGTCSTGVQLCRLRKDKIATSRFSDLGSNLVAIKTIPKKYYSGFVVEGIANDVFNKNGRHANIVRYRHFIHEPITEISYVIMDYYDAGTLLHHFPRFKDGSDSSKATLKSIFRGLASGLSYLHGLRIRHQDIKPENVLMRNKPDGGLIAYLADFGSMYMSDPRLADPSKLCGTLHYAAPEQMDGYFCMLESDVWSLAVTICCASRGSLPFAITENHDVIRKAIKDGSLVKDLAKTSFLFEDKSGAKDLMSGMLQLDPGYRLSAFYVLRHSYFKAERTTAQATNSSATRAGSASSAAASTVSSTVQRGKPSTLRTVERGSSSAGRQSELVIRGKDKAVRGRR